ncbi:MAG TPA: gluconokinase [Acidimicrobiales bacterium]|nr:gluconokinase [Acidimicrobiales bacterium]
MTAAGRGGAAAPATTVIGLDVGTTGVKAVAFGLGTPWRKVAMREYPLLRPAARQAVQDPAVILSAASAALGECVASVGPSQVVGVSLSAAMHGLLALDADRMPVSPLVTWADGRAALEATGMAADPRALDLQQTTGTPVHPMTPLCKLLWYRRNDPATWAAARWWVGLKDYLLLWLTGTLATELSSASGTGLLDTFARAWSPLALTACSVDAEQLPPILATTASLPMDRRVAASVGLPAGTPVIAGAADGPLANLGTGAIAPGVAGLSLGTSGAIRVAVDRPLTDRHGRLFCYALAEPLWIVGGAISNGAEVLRWTEQAVGSDRAQRPGGPAARWPDGPVAESSDGLMMLPFLLPERAPLWEPDLAGAYLGLRHHHGPGHLRRAAMEGVCLQMRFLLDRVDSGYPVTSVRATGGAFGSPLWRDLMAAALDRPLTVVGDEEGTALGAAALGLLALGRAADLEEAVTVLGSATTAGDPVPARPEQVAAFAGMRQRLAVLLDGLTRTVAAEGPPNGPRGG